jgi:hypothetical protein
VLAHGGKDTAGPIYEYFWTLGRHDRPPDDNGRQADPQQSQEILAKAMLRRVLRFIGPPVPRRLGQVLQSPLRAGEPAVPAEPATFRLRRDFKSAYAPFTACVAASLRAAEAPAASAATMSETGSTNSTSSRARPG